MAGYADHARRYLKPHLGRILLAELSVAQVEEMFNAIVRDHKAIGRPLTAATVQRIRATLRTALNAALREGLVEENAAALVALPAARRPRAVVWTAARVEHWRRTGERPPVAVWTVTQTAQFLKAIKDHRLYAAFHVIALRGLRRGEAAGLRWRDVDLDEGVAVICQQIQQRNGQIVAGPPKTPHSMRVIALDSSTVAALRTHQERQRTEQACYGDGYRESGYVFTNRNGDPVAPGHLTHTFQRLVREDDVPPIRLHDLRHGAATLALAAGVELKVVQEMLGHCSIVLTADTYTSVLPEVARTAAEKTAAYVMRAAGVVPGTSRRRGRAPTRRPRPAIRHGRASLAHRLTMAPATHIRPPGRRARSPAGPGPPAAKSAA